MLDIMRSINLWQRKDMRISKFIVLSILFLSSFFSHSQSRIKLHIQPNKNTYPQKKYSFSKVIDARADREQIGIIYTSNRQYEHIATLRAPLEKEFYLFLADVFPNTNSETKILVEVNQFEIGHILANKDTGFVTMNLSFYRLRNDSTSFISNYSKRFAETADDVFLTHPNRMKRAILSATADMELHLNESATQKFAPISALGSAEYKALKDAGNASSSPGQPGPDSLEINPNTYSQNILNKEDSQDLKKIILTNLFFYFE